MKNVNPTQRKRGFTLIELILVILVMAVLIGIAIAGGSATIKKSQVSRTESDLHNFSLAIEAAMNETPSVANIHSDDILVGGAGADKDDFDATKPMGKIIAAVNANLAAEYQLTTKAGTGLAGVTIGNGGAITATTSKNLDFADALNNSRVILQSAKTDAWGNPYYVVFDFGERHAQGQSDFFITVVSAGPNAQTVVGGNIESDDLFLLVQYSDGDVSSVIYNCAKDALLVTTSVNAASTPSFVISDYKTATKTLTVKGVPGTMLYSGGADNTSYTDSVLPVNF